MRKILTDAEILKLLNESWNFHVKQVSKYKYIITRRGQSTQSHGAFNEEYWKRIMDVKKRWIKEPQVDKVKVSIQNDSDIEDARWRKIKAYKRLERKFLDALSVHRAIYMMLDCRYRKEGFCIRWKFSKKNPIFKLMKEYHDFFEDVSEFMRKCDDDEEKFFYRSYPLFCINCCAYEPRELLK